MEHELIPPGEIHAPHNWVVADEAARLALTPTETDVRKYLYQESDKTEWVLTGLDPVEWTQHIGPAGPAGTTGAAGLSAYEVAVSEGFVGTETEWLEFLQGADGDDGREVELQTGATHVQWRYVGEATWTDLVALSAITGPQGIQGIQGDPGPAGGAADIAAEIHAATSKTTPVDADEFGIVDSAASNVLKKLTWANLKATLFAYFQGLFREKLTAARTYYVRSDGSDSNTGLANTSGSAFLTIQKAIDVASALDNGGFNITIQLGDATYSAGASLKSFVGSGRIVIQGNSTTPANVHVSVASGNVVAGVSVIGVYEISYMKLTSAAAGNLVSLSGATTSVVLRGNVYGSAGGGTVYAHVSAQDNASIDFGAVAYAIDGGAGYHLYSSTGGIINCNVLTVTLTGTPAFAGAYAYASMTGITRAVSNTYTGAATGKRYEALSNGIVQTAAGATVLPGDVAGTTATGGLYI